MQKILFLSTSLNIGGTEKFLATLVERMKDQFDFTVGYIKENGPVGRRLADSGIPVIHVPRFTDMIAAMRDGRFSLLHTFLYRANIMGRVAGRIAGIPAIVSSQQAIDAWKKPWHVLADGSTARFCDTIIANASFTRDLLIRREHIPAERISVVYNGIDPAASAPKTSRADVRRSLGIPADAPLVISVTRLHREKGADLIPLIARGVPEAYFLIVGDGPEKASLERSCAGNAKLIMTGWRGDIPDLLSASDLFLLPSREESFPQAILEAMAQGLPTVAADAGGVRELVKDGETGILAPVEDTGTFARAVRQLLGHGEEERTTMRARARAAAERFSEDAMVGSIRTIYTKLTGGK